MKGEEARERICTYEACRIVSATGRSARRRRSGSLPTGGIVYTVRSRYTALAYC